MDDSTWHPGVPGVGSKLRDANLVNDYLIRWDAKIVGVPLVGLCKEASKYTGKAKFIVADSDAAIRSLWKAANEGRLEVEAEYARRLWDTLLRLAEDVKSESLFPQPILLLPEKVDKDVVGDAWKHLRNIEQEAIASDRHAAWAMCIFAGAIGARRRRNGSGSVNIPYAPKSKKFGGNRDRNWLPSRIASAERLRESDRWAKGRLLCHPFDDWTSVFSEIDRVVAVNKTYLYSDVVLLIDPPYGHEKGQLYDGQWTDTDRDQLALYTRMLVQRGVRAIVWCDANDLNAFCPLGLGVQVFWNEQWWTITAKTEAGWLFNNWETTFVGDATMFTRRRDQLFEWTFRATNVHMKSGGIRQNGVEPNRTADGGYIGISR